MFIMMYHFIVFLPVSDQQIVLSVVLPLSFLRTCIVFCCQSLKSYSVSDLHQSVVTCFEWSLNGLKLFSGDSDGVIVCTEFDFTIVRTLFIMSSYGGTLISSIWLFWVGGG